MDKELQDQLDDLTADFARQVPTRLREIHALYDRLDLANWDTDVASELHTFLHNLAGTSSTLKQESLGEAATQLAHQLADWNNHPPPTYFELQAMGLALNNLEQIALTRLPVRRDHGVAQQRHAQPAHTKPLLVHVVDDDPTFAQTVAKVLEHRGYRVEQFRYIDDFIQVCRDGAEPDLVLLDMEFPDDNIGGALGLAALRSSLKTQPLAICISRHDDIRSRLAAFRAGMARYLVKPVDFDHLGNLVDELCAQPGMDPYRVLIADDDNHALQAYAIALRAVGMVVEITTDPLEILDKVRSFMPDVLILDVYMPKASGPEIAAVLREDEQLVWLPILFLSAETDPAKHALALAHGGDDFLVKPVRPAYLQAAVKARAWRARRSRRWFAEAMAGREFA